MKIGMDLQIFAGIPDNMFKRINQTHMIFVSFRIVKAARANGISDFHHWLQCI